MRNQHFILFLIILLFGCQSKQNELALRPNIVLIMTDDQGHGDLGFHGNPLIKTPVLDELAKSSVRLTNFYVSPVCAPTRSSLMTGRYSIRTGVYDTYRGGAIMATEEVTIAEVLKEQGYRTAIFGKWHLGDNYPYRPQDQGFENTLVHGGGGLEQPGDSYENFSRKGSSYFDPYLHKNGKKIQVKGYCSDIYTDEAIKFIKGQEEKPFFLYLAFNAPHTPLEVPQSYLDLYKGMEYNTDTFAIQGSNEFDRMRPKDVEDAKKVYAMVTNIDDNVGRLLKVLEEEGLQDNTLLIFLTDNGPQQFRYKSGLNGRKSSVLEGGVRVPSFWHFPEVFGAARNENQLSAHIDVLPTIADLLGISIHNGLDGKSLLPILTDKKESLGARTLYSHWMRGFPRPYHNMAVRTDSFKLTSAHFFANYPEDFQLFDLRKDPFETTNLSKQYPDVVEAMAKEYKDWLARAKNNPNLNTPRYIPLTTPEEESVLLKRNDWKGPGTNNWGSIESYGYWDVEVTEEGFYDVELFFHDTLPGRGMINLIIGPNQQNQRITPLKEQRFHFNDLHLFPGQYRLEPWYQGPGRKLYGPFEVAVRYKGKREDSI